MGKKILITGGAGYIGSHVNKALAARGYDTLILDNLTYGHREFSKWGEFILADLADREILRLIFEKYNIQAVMHFAAFAYVGESIIEPGKYYLNNVTNTLNLLEIMLEFEVNTMIFSSSCAVYGHPMVIPITENHPRAPINPYGRSKLMIEDILEDYYRAYGLKYVSLRYFNAAGADPETELGEWHEPETHLIPLVLDAAAGLRRHIEIYGTNYETKDGTCVRDYIHVNDLADAHILALEYLMDGGLSNVFNLGNGSGFSVKEVISCARNVTGKDIQEVVVGQRPGDPPMLISNWQKARSQLNWKPQYTELHDIIKTAWAWHRHNFTHRA